MNYISWMNFISSKDFMMDGLPFHFDDFKSTSFIKKDTKKT
jgi:hypothetical protein